MLIGAFDSAHQACGEERYQSIHLETYLSGSYARNTALRPRTTEGIIRRPDVDIIVVTNHSTSDQPSTVIATLRRALKQCGYGDLESNRRSVCVSLASVEMDVVPIIPDPWRDGYWLIADKHEERWLETNPMGHNKWALDINRRTDGTFKPLVKLIKWWKRENLPHLRRPKGFILETLVAELMDSKERSYEELVCKLLERVTQEYQVHATIGQVPYLRDPSVDGNDVFSRVKPEEFKRFYDVAAAHAVLARRAQRETDEDKALALWQRIFSDRFRKSAAKSSSLLRPAAVNVAPLVFPSQAIVPPNKPAGFA